MSVEVTQLAIGDDLGSRGGVTLTREANGGRDAPIRVTWFCGDERTFTAEGLRDAINHAKATESVDAWLHVVDRHGSKAAILIRDGRLYADTHPNYLAPSRSVSWDEFTRAANRLIPKQSKAK